jgi:cbb3-type cytochrome oxidase subunit 3
MLRTVTEEEFEMDRNIMMLIVFLITVLVVIAFVVWMYRSERRSKRLREKFGAEYDHALNERGDRRQAETELEVRTKRVKLLDIRPLTKVQAETFSEQWRSIQATFVDDPKRAVTGANHLVKELMQARGYPVGDFERRAADISVDHPNVVENYRKAREIAERNQSGQCTTEDLRKAVVHYRALFEELLEAREPAEVRT